MLASLKAGASAREPTLRKLSRYICPWRGRLPGYDKRETYTEADDIFNAVACDAVLRGASGMTSGMTPRNISWFKPAFNDQELNEASGARQWLDAIDHVMKTVLADGGFYQAMQNFNLDLLWAGAGLLYTEKGDENILEFQCVNPGAYLVETDTYGRLEACARRIEMTIQEAARRFGEGKLSEQAARRLSRNPYQSVTVWHLVWQTTDEKNPYAYESAYLEEGNRKSALATRGFFEMPYFFTTWNEAVTPYGTGPGDNALADAIQIDILEHRKLEGLEKLTDPPMLAPRDMRDTLNLEPGGLNFYQGNAKITPLIDIAAYVNALPSIQNEIAIVSCRLEKQLMASVFSAMPLESRPAGMSATEFLERKRDALQQLGPIMSAYEPRVLTPLLNRVMACLQREGLIPPLPEGLQNAKEIFMKMEFISPMANALRQSGAETTRALLSDVANMAQATQKVELLD